MSLEFNLDIKNYDGMILNDTTFLPNFVKKKKFKFQILFFVFHLEKQTRIKPLDNISILTHYNQEMFF